MISSDMISIVLKVTALLTETFLGYLLLSRFLDVRRFRGYRLCTAALYALHAGLILTEEYTIGPWLGDGYFVYLLIHCSMLLAYSFLLCMGRPIFKLFLPIVYVSLITLCQFPFSLVLQFCRPWLPGSIMRIMQEYNSTIGATLLLSLITLTLIRYRLDTHQNYPVSYYIIMIAAPLLNMFSITSLKNYFPQISEVIYYIGTSALLIELLIYYMTWQSTQEYAKRIQLQLINQQMDYQNQHMAELNNIVEEYHRLRHDTKNQFACMDRMLSQNKYDSLKEYFYTLSKDIYALDNQIETGNEIVNQVINIKYATAHKLNIPMDIRIALPRQLNIPDHLLCSLTANLLDNAIEASQKLQEPEIFIEMKIIKDYLSLTVKNKIDKSAQDSALTVRTTKQDGKYHGLGREIIKDIVRKYNGISTKEVKDGWYLASVMLELPE